jgi:glycosyltransferase involved in cell wall biosynthesis
MPEILMAAYTNYRRDPRVRREAEALVDAGFTVTFMASRQPGEAAREVIDGVCIIKVRTFNSKRTSNFAYVLDYVLFFLCLALHCSLHPLRYRLIHVNNMPDFLVLATWLPRLLGRPVIHDVHDLMPELYAEKFRMDEGSWIGRALLLQERWAGRFASAVLTVEERLKDILSSRGIPRSKIHVLMNLPDDRIFCLSSTRPRKDAAAPFVLVYHGTLARRLGLDIAIAAIRQARQQVPNIELRIIGAGEERGALIALREELGLQKVVAFSEGFVPVEKVPSLILDADVGVIPLRISSGTDVMLPTKLLEYVSLGIPCIVPRTGTISRYFDETMVRFFEASSVESLAEAIVDLYLHPSTRAALASNATRRFGSIYNWSEHKKVYTTLVSELIAG